MKSHFFAYIARMRYITRWALMRNTFSENVQEHSHMVAVLAHAHVHLRHRRGLRAGADGIGEDVPGGEAALFNEGERLAELLLRLLREAGDEVRGNGGAVKPAVQQFHGSQIPGGIVLPVHPL